MSEVYTGDGMDDAIAAGGMEAVRRTLRFDDYQQQNLDGYLTEFLPAFIQDALSDPDTRRNLADHAYQFDGNYAALESDVRLGLDHLRQQGF